MASTLLQLKTRARELSDMEDSLFISDSELTSYVNQSSLELYDLLVGSFEDYYLSQTANTAVASGEDTIALPSDFYKLRGVDYLISGDQWQDLKPFSFQERNQANVNLVQPGYYNTTGVRYRLQGSNVKLTPADKAEGTYRVWYVPKLTLMSSDSDTLPDYMEAWDEYVVVDAAIKMLQKEESSTSALDQMKVNLKKRIEAMAKNRDSAHPEVILPSSRPDFYWLGSR